MKNLSWVQVITHFTILLVGLSVGYFAWIGNLKSEKSTPTSKVIQVTSTSVELASKGDAPSANKQEEVTITTKNKSKNFEIKKETTDTSVGSKSIAVHDLGLTKMEINNKRITSFWKLELIN